MKLFKLILFISLLSFSLTFVARPHAQNDSSYVLPTRDLFTIKYNFTQPSDVAVSKDGNIYVLDGVNDLVKSFDSTGKYLFSFGGSGDGNGKFNFPLGIALDKNGKIYVADSGNHRVQIFNEDGKYLAQFSTNTGLKGSKPSDPTDVAVSADLKRCYVVDNDNHWVLIYNLEKGMILEKKGAMGMGKKDFRFPFMIDTDNKGNIYIVEVINTRIKVLDPDGNYLTIIGGWGVEKGEFYRPKGVAVDDKNRVFVSDSYLGVIQIFDSDGKFLYILGDDKAKILKFETPTGIFVDSKRRIYVVEMTSNRVRVLSLE